MRDITTTTGFLMECRLCKTEKLVDATALFKENGLDREVTVYFHPNAQAKDKPIGYSDNGSGDRFACRICHILEWYELVKKEQKS